MVIVCTRVDWFIYIGIVISNIRYITSSVLVNSTNRHPEVEGFFTQSLLILNKAQIMDTNRLNTLYNVVRDQSYSVAMRKSQLVLLQNSFDRDCLSSVRPKVGKVYHKADHEIRKATALKVCRDSILNISIEEATEEVAKNCELLKSTLISSQSWISKEEYLHVAKYARNCENYKLMLQNKRHQGNLKHSSTNHLDINIPKPGRLVKHIDSMKAKRKRRNNIRRTKKRNIRNANLNEQLARVKSSGCILNFTDIELPDSAYLYLSKGNTFVPATNGRKHDLVYDTSEFLRK